MDEKFHSTEWGDFWSNAQVPNKAAQGDIFFQKQLKPMPAQRLPI